MNFEGGVDGELACLFTSDLGKWIVIDQLWDLNVGNTSRDIEDVS